jgi:sulfur relay (sulfurtransferase) DsrF/TusC family protein
MKRLLGHGIEVFVVEDGVAARGLERGDLLEGIQPFPRAGLPRVFAAYEQVWRW